MRISDWSSDVCSSDLTNAVSLEVRHHGEYLDFSYAVWPLEQERPVLTPDDVRDEEERRYFRAEVFLREGWQDYDIMGCSNEAVISDILAQYERHRQYLPIVHGNPVAQVQQGKTR